MGLRELAVKPGELKPLSRCGLLLFAARCAIRVEPWIPGSAVSLWADGLAFVVASAFGAPADPGGVSRRRRAISDSGAIACNRLEAVDAPLGRCMNYATSTLALTVDAICLFDRPELVRVVIDCAKHSGSIAAVWAHAGRVRARRGEDAVDFACTKTWDAIRADIAPLAAAGAAVGRADDPVRALRELAPLWVGRAPAWASPP